jgi:hypothetical protein
MAQNHFSSLARLREGEISLTLALTLALPPGRGDSNGRLQKVRMLFVSFPFLLNRGEAVKR